MESVSDLSSIISDVSDVDDDESSYYDDDRDRKGKDYDDQRRRTKTEQHAAFDKLIESTLKKRQGNDSSSSLVSAALEPAPKKPAPISRALTGVGPGMGKPKSGKNGLVSAYPSTFGKDDVTAKNQSSKALSTNLYSKVESVNSDQRRLNDFKSLEDIKDAEAVQIVGVLEIAGRPDAKVTAADPSKDDEIDYDAPIVPTMFTGNTGSASPVSDKTKKERKRQEIMSWKLIDTVKDMKATPSAASLTANGKPPIAFNALQDKPIPRKSSRTSVAPKPMPMNDFKHDKLKNTQVDVTKGAASKDEGKLEPKKDDKQTAKSNSSFKKPPMRHKNSSSKINLDQALIKENAADIKVHDTFLPPPTPPPLPPKPKSSLTPAPVKPKSSLTPDPVTERSNSLKPDPLKPKSNSLTPPPMNTMASMKVIPEIKSTLVSDNDTSTSANSKVPFNSLSAKPQKGNELDLKKPVEGGSLTSTPIVMPKEPVIIITNDGNKDSSKPV